LVILLLLFKLGTAKVSAQEVDFGSDRVPVTARSEFECVVQFLQQIVDHRGKPGSHVIYISQVGTRERASFVHVYWPRDHSILLLELRMLLDELGGPPCRQKIKDEVWNWYDYKTRIDLKTGVVPTPEDARGSSFLATRPWVDAVIADCRRTGYRLRLSKAGRPKEQSNSTQRTPSAGR
jgi:hypothetical protein